MVLLQRQRIIDSLGAGRRARVTAASGVLTLPLGGRSFVRLGNEDGTLNAAGKFYYQRTGEAPPENGVNFNQQPTRKGKSEFIQFSGKEARVRTLGPNGKWTLTALGKRFFSKKQIEFVLSIPVKITGARKNGTAYTRYDWLPVDLLGGGPDPVQPEHSGAPPGRAG